MSTPVCLMVRLVSSKQWVKEKSNWFGMSSSYFISEVTFTNVGKVNR